MIREDDDDDAWLCLLFPEQWTFMDSHDNASRDWADRSEHIFKQLWPFFDVVAGVHARHASPLAEQLAYSLKMYRRGATASEAGVEFICKWSALEGLVSPGDSAIRRTIVERLETLFSDRKHDIEPLIAELWKRRNKAVHTARATGAVSPMDSIDELFLGVAVFALAHLDRAESLQELWAFASSFDVPSFARQTRPGRYRIDGGSMPFRQQKGVGKHIEALFAAHAPASRT
jgi:hypothetical protein